MKKCVWARPVIVVRVEYLEWAEGDHLRHAKIAGLREDKDGANRHKGAWRPGMTMPDLGFVIVTGQETSTLLGSQVLA